MPAKHTSRIVWESAEEKKEAAQKASSRGLSLSKLIRQQVKKVSVLKK